ncbi:MAG: GntR family transcriptional regulator [Candidimonas sp.]|jgi:DNA-binding GntR family transcriptional regulator
MSIASIQKYPSLREQVYAGIRDAIVRGRLAQGTLVSEQVIADQVGVSRTPVREALLQLAQEGLVEFARNAGVRISALTAERSRQAYELRSCVEAHCVRVAASNQAARGALVAQLRAQLAEQRRIASARDPGAWVDANRDFHRRIVEAGGNGLMLGAWDRLQGYVMLAGFGFHTVHPERMAQFLQEHGRIVDHIEHADGAGAQRALQVHLQSGAAYFEQMLPPR